ncbi:MAG: ATP synthase F1 subunit epsilon [Raoultibacter sp.]
MSQLACDIVTPQAKLFSEDVYTVIVPGIEGEMGFLEGHAPLVSALSDGVVRLRTEAGADMRSFALQGGYVEVTGEKVIVLADRACPVEDIDVEKVTVEAAEAKAALESLSADDTAAAATLQRAVLWCEVQLKAAQV